MSHRLIVAPKAVAQPGLWEPALTPMKLVESWSPDDASGAVSIWVHTGLEAWEPLVRSLSDQGKWVVVMSTMPSNRETMAALQAGARGYCHAFSGPDLLRQIRMVVENGGLWVGDSLVRMLTQLVTASGRPPDHLVDTLSEREQAVAKLVAAGLANKQIARELAITERTVKAHISSIFRKMDVRDRLQLVLKMTGQA